MKSTIKKLEDLPKDVLIEELMLTSIKGGCCDGGPSEQRRCGKLKDYDLDDDVEINGTNQ